MAKILLVEDDANLSATVRDWLKAEKHVVETTSSGEDALQLLRHFQYELIVLDWNLPDIPGQDVLQRFRSSGGQTPVIFMTGRDDLKSKTVGLDSGADDYMTKPILLPELSARIRSCLRRSGEFQPFEVSIGNVYLNGDKRAVTVNGERVHLTTKEYCLLEFLMRHPKEVFGTRDLLERVWPSDTEIEESTVRVCVRSLRKKITVGDTCIVKTILGSGYTIDGD